MKSIIASFFLGIFSLFICQTLNAMIAGDSPDLVECMQSLNDQDIIKLIDSASFYRGGDWVLPIEKENPSYINTTWIRNAYTSVWWYKCFKYTDNYKEISIQRIVPVYLPKKLLPIGFQVIFTKQWVFSESFFIPNWNKSHPPGFIYTKGFYQKNIYDISLTEPFISAPMLQMYNYLWQPLLVARSGTGVVIDVYFQNRPNLVNPMERAKKFLWKKWYNP